MLFREFIEQEIREGHVYDLEEFRRELYILEFEDGEEIESEKFEDYLDYNLDSVAIIHNFGAYYHSMYYKISIAYEKEEIE